MKKNTQNITGTRKGFTLIETLVSITILLTMITGGFVAIRAGLVSTFAARDQVTAFFLAQEAIELVKNVRDTNAVVNAGLPLASQIPWNEGLDGCASGNCYADAANLASPIGPCTGSCTLNLYQDSNGLYTHDTSGTTATRFTRSVQISAVPDNSGELEVRVVVTYDGKTLEVSEHIFDVR